MEHRDPGACSSKPKRDTFIRAYRTSVSQLSADEAVIFAAAVSPPSILFGRLVQRANSALSTG
jgi:hypothetical protein